MTPLIHYYLWVAVAGGIILRFAEDIPLFKEIFAEVQAENALKKELSECERCIRDYKSIIAPEDLQRFSDRAEKIRHILDGETEE
jgi:hypothetical protein